MNVDRLSATNSDIFNYKKKALYTIAGYVNH